MTLIPREPPERVKNLRDELKQHGRDLTDLIEQRNKVDEMSDSDRDDLDKKFEKKNDAVRLCKADLAVAEREWREQRQREVHGED
jgi:hypothetical protein